MRKFFPAANTPDGFFSYFSSIYNESDDDRVIFIKGGSGTGKSTLMKKLSEDALQKGYEIEQFFCSSDPDSLDGVRFLNTKTAIVDATAPHKQDPEMPGISGKIYNIADFWDDSILLPFKKEINSFSIGKKVCFDMCYRYLKSAKALYPIWENEILYEAISENFQFVRQKKTGKTRFLFASGITPKGNVNLLDSILTGKIIGIEESVLSSAIIKKINKNANLAGYDTELYFCPLFPDSKAEHLVIKDLRLSFTTLNEFHRYKKCDEVINAKKECKIPPQVKELINISCDYLNQAKAFHRQIEEIYIRAMDFNKMDSTYESLKNELL